eukprot:TRINITY_DN401_c1_g1_i1.p1 TRINITY_DN401_c1_g1~~TRINITY_DN401_c1_g1_i1.p1  ORF type:complete len:692 (-),score=102.51 TRINITY_DN401_c1_g1_i1:23-2098(-)
MKVGSKRLCIRSDDELDSNLPESAAPPSIDFVLFAMTDQDKVPTELSDAMRKPNRRIMMVPSQDREYVKQAFNIDWQDQRVFTCLFFAPGKIARVSDLYDMCHWQACLSVGNLMRDSIVIIGDPVTLEFAQDLVDDVVKACQYAEVPHDEIAAVVKGALNSPHFFTNASGMPARLKILANPTLPELRGYLQTLLLKETAPVILIQLCGHGMEDGTFLLQDGPLRMVDLREILAGIRCGFPHAIELFFNCCHGDVLVGQFCGDTKFEELTTALPRNALPPNALLPYGTYAHLSGYRIKLTPHLQIELFPRIAGTGEIPAEGGYGMLITKSDERLPANDSLVRAVKALLQPVRYTLDRLAVKEMEIEPGLYVFAYNVGCGDAASVLHMDVDRKCSAVQIDGGRIWPFKANAAETVLFLRPCMKGLILTHCDDDHSMGLTAVVSTLEDGDNLPLLCSSPIFSDAQTAKMRSAFDILRLATYEKQERVKITQPKKGDLHSFGTIKVHVLAPDGEAQAKVQEHIRVNAGRKPLSVPNQSSIVVLLELSHDGKISWALFTGDAPAAAIIAGLDVMPAAVPRDADGRFYVDYMDIPHHGSKHNVSAEENLFTKVLARQYLWSSDGGQRYDTMGTDVWDLLAKQHDALKSPADIYFTMDKFVENKGATQPSQSYLKAHFAQPTSHGWLFDLVTTKVTLF